MEASKAVWDELVLRIRAVAGVPRWVEQILTSSVVRPKHASLEACIITRSYLDFLQEQIELGARGAEWNEVLQDRLNRLKHCENVTIWQLSVHSGERDFYLCARSDNLEIIHWESR